MQEIKFRKLNKNELENIEGGFLGITTAGVLAFTQLVATAVSIYQVFNSKQGSVSLNGIGTYRWDDTRTKTSIPKEPKIITMPYDF